MTSFLLALTRTVVAASLLITITSLLITITSLLGTDMARAAGALAIGTCGAYGLAYDFPQPEAASAAALGQCSGDCKLATAMRGNCARAFDRRAQCLRCLRLRCRPAARGSAEYGAALLLPQRRQGLRDPRLGLRRQGLIRGVPAFRFASCGLRALPAIII
jgi:hypothetical protein